MNMHAPMVNLAKTAEEVKKDMPAMPTRTVPASPTVPEYPYGCCISLDDATLAKLGIAGDLPPLGAVIHFCCQAKVTNVSQREEMDASGNATKCLRVELQITDMGSPMAPDTPRSSRWYSSGEPDGDED